MVSPGSGPAERCAKILLVDGHPIVRAGLKGLIESIPWLSVCGEATSVAEALEQISLNDPDLIILDIPLKGRNGIELIKSLRGRGATVKVLVASIHDELVYAERVLRAGANGFISKAEPIQKIGEAVKVVLEGGVFLSDRAKEMAVSRMVGRSERRDRAPLETLSDRELECFELIGQGLTTREIAADLHLSVKTIETHKDRIKAKLSLSSGSKVVIQAVRWVVEQESGSRAM